MAKLKAHGVELFRIAREIGPEELTLKAEKSGFGPSLTIWERQTYAFMSDGYAMSKLDIRFTPDFYDPAGRLCSYGWKRGKKVTVVVRDKWKQKAEEGRGGWRLA